MYLPLLEINIKSEYVIHQHRNIENYIHSWFLKLKFKKYK